MANPDKPELARCPLNFPSPFIPRQYTGSLQCWHCEFGDRKGSQPVKSWVLGFVGGDDLTAALQVIAQVVTTTYIILSSNKTQNSGDILEPANPGPPGKTAVKTKRQCMLSGQPDRPIIFMFSLTSPTMDVLSVLFHQPPSSYSINRRNFLWTDGRTYGRTFSPL